MANKADRQYFENFTAAADYTCQASRYLVECLNNFDLDNIKAMLETMHEFEHKGDDKHHEMSGMLAKAFVTPVDREDLAMISQSMEIPSFFGRKCLFRRNHAVRRPCG